ncbi:hypothetical protein M3Y99_00639000 [Aphelenchoides fujianensis]|nr:hypothetical protein M3Y99_00639000 [Aphelenchoides fujianensis]
MWNDDIAEAGGGLFHAAPPFYEYLYTYQNAERMCANGEFLTPRFLHIWERFSTKYADKCHLSFNSITALTRKNPNHLELLDQPLADALDRLDDAGALEHTMLVIMGDSGQKEHEIASTYVGRVEERMPLMAVYVPPKFRRAEAEKFANLRANANRLTSAFDVHQTLQEAMGFEQPTERSGSSLFHPIEADRSCQDARIPAQHCMCMKPLDVAVLNETQKFQARALMRTQIHAAVHELPCVFSYELDDPRSFTPFTISPVARSGVRRMAEWLRFLADGNAEDASGNELLEIEVETPVRLRWSADQPADQRFAVRGRAILHRESGELTVVARPWVVQHEAGFPAGCRTKILDDICACAPHEQTTNPRIPDGPSEFQTEKTEDPRQVESPTKATNSMNKANGLVM